MNPQSKRRILAVDDEPHMLRLLERLFTEKTPYQITTTSNSLEVLSILDQERFDLVISDLKMPGLDGLEILGWIGERKRTEEVIIITAFGSPETAKEALDRGAFDYVTKPFRGDQFLFVVERALRMVDVRRELAHLKDLFSVVPFGKAAQAFEIEYVRRLSAALGGDFDAIAKESGMSREAIFAALQAPRNRDL